MKTVTLRDEQLNVIVGGGLAQNVSLSFALDANILTGNSGVQNLQGTGGNGGLATSQFLGTTDNGILDTTAGMAAALTDNFSCSVSIKVKEVPISFPKPCATCGISHKKW